MQNTREAAQAIKGMTLKKAKSYLEDVLEHKQTIPFRRFMGGVGRHPQAKMHNHTQSRYPKKSCIFLQSLLRNAESNAEVRAIYFCQASGCRESLYCVHVSVVLEQHATGRRNQSFRKRRDFKSYRAGTRTTIELASLLKSFSGLTYMVGSSNEVVFT